MIADLYAYIIMSWEKSMDLLEMEISMTSSVRRELESLQSELGKMKCYINDSAEKKSTNQCIPELLMEIKETVSEANYILEAFFFDYASRRKGGYMISKTIINILWGLNECLGRGEANKLTSLKDRVRALNKSLDLLGIKKTTFMEGVDQLRSQGCCDDENSFVGFQNDVEKLVSILAAKENDQTCCSTIAIQGIGGIGKTSLAKRVYNDDEVQRYFEGFSWTTVPRNFTTRNMLEDIYLQLFPESKEEIKTFSNMELVQQIYEAQLSKKYLIVLDDVWNEDIWTCLNLAFPSYNTVSKLVVTTRSRQVAEKVADKGITHTMRTLTSAESWNLFLMKKTFSGRNPGEMQVVGENLVKKCNGLPLGIVSLGNLLGRNHTLNEWKSILQRIDHYSSTERGSQEFSEIQRVLALINYEDLPYYLKPCFLYLGLFPENSQIELEKLYRLWIADGLIPSKTENSSIKMEIAECYLDELVSRNMVQVQEGKTTTSGKIKTIYLHDVMRDLCLSKGKEENLMGVMDLKISKQLRHFYPTTSRLALYIDNDEDEDSYFVTLKNDRIQHVRSLLVFNTNQHREDMRSPLALSSLKALKSLTTLNFNGIHFVKEKELKWIGELIVLRYLSFNGCFIDELPSSVGNLFNLCTLDLRVQTSCRITIPNSLWKIQRLRELFLPLQFVVYRNEKLRLDTLKNLEILLNFDASLCNAKDLDRLTNLRILETTTEGPWSR